MAEVYHALGLNMHQPPGNLLALHNSNERWEAGQILWCYDRTTRMLEGYEDVARLHMSFSGTLLKQLEDSAVRETFHDVDIEDFLNRYKQSNIEFAGTGLYHPVYPLTPPADWDAQTSWWTGLGRHLLGRKKFQGFWPPEMGFCMEMIPMLKRHGYRYVLVDSWYIKPKREMRWEELRYRPYIARYNGEEIIVIPRDRELSDAQESGLDPGWFQHELYERTKWCDFPALVTTWTDGENGGWFRTTHVESGFWGYFYHPILNRCRDGTLGFTPIHISEFLDRYPPTEEVEVSRGAWNTGQHWGGDFTQWTGSLLQKRGWDEVRRASDYYREVKRAFDERGETAGDPEEVHQLIINAYDHILTAETSCNFYWGSRWVHRSFDDLEQAYYLLDTAMAGLRDINRREDSER
ncbi:MAG TPA: glycoside hydrolase family 57 [Nitrospirae bacterium]|nr:glycosyl hydrolase family 57 [bacterium BMS3Abin06]HDH10668.1 glycoside hydrolase family 57 [Nitrospirota bacterium]HDZ01502.1 glycoside hydrolase family 57 [Nitrospirota bacterium]